MDSKEKNEKIVTYRINTETERLLHDALHAEQANSAKLIGLIEDLKSQVKTLQEQLQCLANAKQAEAGAMDTSHPHTASQSQYNTDDEELAYETEWIRSKTRKKRKLNASPPQDGPTPEKPKKAIQPPPIIVDGIKNYQTFHDFLAKDRQDKDFTMKMMSGETVKVNATNDEAYRALTEALTINNCLWHSYENKQERPIRVMVKKLHHTCRPERIVDDLKRKDFKIVEAVSKLSWRTKEPLNMFMLTFDNSEDINKIFKIQTVLGFKVDIQPLKANKLVPQCKRCQAYGHTQKYCAKEPRCVKCTGKHFTKDCSKRAEDKPKCIHCGGSHPANYRGCAIAKEIQLIRNKNRIKPAVVRHHSTCTAGIAEKPITNETGSIATKSVSYAQAAAKNLKKPAQKPSAPENNSKKLDDILKFMLSFDERLKKIESSTNNAIIKNKPK